MFNKNKNKKNLKDIFFLILLIFFWGYVYMCMYIYEFLCLLMKFVSCKVEAEAEAEEKRVWVAAVWCPATIWVKTGEFCGAFVSCLAGGRPGIMSNGKWNDFGSKCVVAPPPAYPFTATFISFVSFKPLSHETSYYYHLLFLIYLFFFLTLILCIMYKNSILSKNDDYDA